MSTAQAYAGELGQKAKSAARQLRTLGHEARQAVLRSLAGELRSSAAAITKANAVDIDEGRAAGLSDAMLDRLLLSDRRIEAIAAAVEEIAAFPDPLGRVLEDRKRPDGLTLRRTSAPIGTIFFIFESRPNVTVDGGALCLKSGNAVILRGGKEAARSNAALAAAFTRALKAHGVSTDAVQLVNTPDRQVVDSLLQDMAHIDLVIPRGGEGLIRAVVEKSKVPVIKHYKGVCHVYVDASAEADKAIRIAINAKAQRPGVCNAMETLLLDRRLASGTASRILEALADEGVQLRGDEDSRRIRPSMEQAMESDWDEEYLDLRLAVRMVDGVEGAMMHIDRHGTGHTDAVVAEDERVQSAFAAGVDSSSVMINASTRFADGGEYGLGAEVGISTDKLHARGPMGVDSLTTYRWLVVGDGHTRG